MFRLKNNPRRGRPPGRGARRERRLHVRRCGRALGGSLHAHLSGQGSNADADIYDGRASWTVLPGLTISGEYANEDGDDIDGKGYYAQALYEFTDVAWKPTFTYRYAKFNDEFNGLAYGYTDWGYWFQGEIAGNYPLYNTNLNSNMLRVKVTPLEKVTVNLFYYNFTFDDPQAFGVTSDDYGDEVDLTVDWQATERVFVSAVLAQLNPGRRRGGTDRRRQRLEVRYVDRWSFTL